MYEKFEQLISKRKASTVDLRRRGLSLVDAGHKCFRTDAVIRFYGDKK